MEKQKIIEILGRKLVSSISRWDSFMNLLYIIYYPKSDATKPSQCYALGLQEGGLLE